MLDIICLVVILFDSISIVGDIACWLNSLVVYVLLDIVCWV